MITLQQILDMLRSGKITPREIAEADIPIADRVLVLIHALPVRDQRLLACECAERALARERRTRGSRPRRSGEPTSRETARAARAARAAAMAAAEVAWEDERQRQLDRLVEMLEAQP